jgi:hypothetical protein
MSKPSPLEDELAFQIGCLGLPTPERQVCFGSFMGRAWVIAGNTAGAVDAVETTAETWIKTKYELGLDSSNLIAYAFHGLEGNFTFEHHDVYLFWHWISRLASFWPETLLAGTIPGRAVPHKRRRPSTA